VRVGLGAPVARAVPDRTVVLEELPPGEAAPAPRFRRRARSRLGRGVLWLLLALVVAAGLVAGVAWLLAPPRLTLLVMGSDARPDELRRGEVGRTDTMLAVVADRAPVDGSPSTVELISIPRDLWVEIPGFGQERINVAYALGGPRAAERAAGDALGLGVDRHLVIGLQGVRDVVDAAGGIEIDVGHPIHDDAYPTDDYGTIVVDIPAGRQHMDGETALRYARTRHQDNDFSRMARQQQVMLGVRSALLRPINWWRLPAVIVAVRRATQTDLGLPQLATLALAFGTSPAEPDRLAVDLDLVDEFRGADGAYLLRARPALRERVATMLAPSRAGVEVLNGTGTAGLATQAADRLRGRELRVVNVGNATRPRPDTTVEVRPGLRRAGRYAASILDLPADVVREYDALPAGVDVRVTLGERPARS
jgi:LCP family protein required for cell wall assembly